MKNLIKMFPEYKKDIEKNYASILSWMLTDLKEYPNENSNSTEAATSVFSAYKNDNDIDFDIPEWIFELSLLAQNLRNNEKGIR